MPAWNEIKESMMSNERYTLEDPQWQWHHSRQFTLDLSWSAEGPTRHLCVQQDHADADGGGPRLWATYLCEGGERERVAAVPSVHTALEDGLRNREALDRPIRDAAPF